MVLEVLEQLGSPRPGRVSAQLPVLPASCCVSPECESLLLPSLPLLVLPLCKSSNIESFVMEKMQYDKQVCTSHPQNKSSFDLPLKATLKGGIFNSRRDTLNVLQIIYELKKAN